MKKIHLDTDIGGDPDDLCALAMLLKWSDLKITGITTVGEKEGKRAGYAKYVLKLADREDIPVKAGAEVSSGYFSSNFGLPSEKDYWPEPIQASPNDLDEALELLKSSIEQGASITAIGPYTNLCLLDKKYPGILRKAEIYLMGGLVYPIRDGFPNWGNDMDWNIQVDVNSAKYVLENSNPILVPLAITVETALRGSYIPKLRDSGRLGEIIATQAEAVNREYHNADRFKVFEKTPEDVFNFQHDPLTCAIALGWNNGVKIEEVPLLFEIRDGQLHERIDPSGKLTKIVTQVDGNAFNELWLKTIIGS